jgi:hypothetical protein
VEEKFEKFDAIRRTPCLKFRSLLFVHGVCSPNDEVGGCLFGWFIGRSVGWPSIHKPTKNCMLYCFLVIKFLLVCMKKYTPLVRRSAPLFEQIFLFDSLMNS